MATISESGVEESTLPGSKRRVTVPAVGQTSATAQTTFTTPFIAGESAIGTVNTITKKLNTIADENAVSDAVNQGQKDQEAAIKAGNTNYLPTGNAFTLSGRAYEAGATVALVSKKSNEIDDQLVALALKRANNVDAFNIEAEELKTKITGNLPIKVQNEISLKFDKAKNNLVLQINDRMFKETIQSNIIEISTGIDRSTNKIFNAIKDVGLGSEAIPEEFASITTNLQVLRELGMGPKDLKTVSDGVRQQIFAQWLREEFVSRKDDPNGLATLKKELQSGNYTFGALGEEYGDVFPGGKQITLAEGSAYATILDKYKTDYAKNAAGERYTFNLQHTMNVNQIADGNKGFSVTWDNEGNQTIGHNTTELTYNEAQSSLVGNDAAKLMEHKIEFSAASITGDIISRAKTTSMAKIAEGYTAITLLETQAKNAKTPYEQAVFSKAAEMTKKRLDAVIKDRQDSKTNGNAMNDFWNNRNIHGLNPNINITTKEGTYELMSAFEKYSNSPMNHSQLPIEQANIELSTLKTGASVSIQQGLAEVDKLVERQGPFAGGYITSALTKSSANDKSNDYALVEIISLKRQKKQVEAETAMAAYKEAGANELALKQSLGDTEWNTEKADYETKFIKKFGKDIDLKTSYGRSVLAVTYQFYLKNRQAGIQDASAAFESAASFVTKNHASVELVNGQRVMFSADYLKDNNGTNMTNFIQDQLNDTLKRPWLYNIVAAGGQTIDRMIDNNEEYKMVFDNGRFVLRDKAGNIVAQPMQKYPSDANSLYMSDVVITVHPSQKPRTVFDDAEKTWDEFGGKKTFSKKLPTLYKENNPVTYDPFDETGEIFREGDDQKLLFYGEGLQKTFNENYIQTDTAGRKTMAYNDWMVPSLVGSAGKNYSIAQAISLKAVENNLTDRDLLWAYQNIPMMSKLQLNNKDRRNYVLDNWKNNFDSLSKLTTPTDGATRMSPWQVIMKLADEFVVPDVDPGGA
tara:strand:+ start:502 stop:3432 length:2931 start_codon:yes stop_codon:yes gene_type:complete